ncbi:hypothetical protein COCON_G00195270 [Conger conger]|uniref:Uncharacterized protein n=1 Tax=Conger conger TaxID=82655 RepID=A0A9Q1HQA1_CONCO|nr:hypothetical protein COCON_G00195270 [Conger conger]
MGSRIMKEGRSKPSTPEFHRGFEDCIFMLEKRPPGVPAPCLGLRSCHSALCVLLQNCTTDVRTCRPADDDAGEVPVITSFLDVI